MLILDLKLVGNNLYQIRNKKLLSRADVAEKAGLSERTYADIERGSVNMRIETVLKICYALNITPDDIFVLKEDIQISEENIVEKFKSCSIEQKETAIKLLDIYMNSL